MAYPEKRDGNLTGHWYGEVDLRHKGGPRMRERFERKADAVGWEAYVKATGERPPWSQEGASGHTFASVAQDCKREYAPWQHKRDRSVMQRLDYVMAGPVGKLPIGSITRGHLQDLVNDLRRRPGKSGEPMRTSTIDRYLTGISTVITFAETDPHRYGKVTRPVFPWQGKCPAREETLSFEQEDAVVRVLEEQGKTTHAFLVRVLAATGLRRGELYGLKPAQIENEKIKLKGADTKTDAPRWVYISPEMARDLRALVASGGLPKPFQLWNAFKRACEVCGYSSELTIHSLRHTRATRLLEAGVDPQTTMQMLGWTSFDTMKRYRHVSEGLQREAAEKVSHRRGETLQNSTVVPFPSLAKSTA